jgi:hypothetical protein
VSYYFDAVVIAARQDDLIRRLQHPLVPGPLAPINLELHRVGRGRFVVFGWRAGARRPDAWRELQALAYDLSLDFETAVAVHYDDQVGERFAAVAHNGDPLRQFGDPDEVWVPYGENGELVLDGPRYRGDALPEDVECDCVRNGIDAALEAAWLHGWLTCRDLVQVAASRKEPVWRRPGTAG